MKNNFERCMPLILIHEGGYSNHPADKGGRTLQGITQSVLNGYLRSINRPEMLIVPGLVHHQLWTTWRNAIYRMNYWDQCKCDDMPSGVDYALFDAAVNSGPNRAVKWLQRALGFTGPNVDGIVGGKTLGAVLEYADHSRLINAMMDRRLAFLQSLSNWKDFRTGWTHRVRDVRSTSLAWAKGAAPTVTATAVPGGNMRARIEDAKPMPSTAVADAAMGAGGGSTLGGGILQQAQDALTPYAASSAIVGRIVVALILGGLLVTAAGAGVRWWQRRKAARLADALDLEVPT